MFSLHYVWKANHESLLYYLKLTSGGDVTVIYCHITISMLRGDKAYCVKLRGEDLLRCSNKIESVGLRKCPYNHYFTENVVSQ